MAKQLSKSHLCQRWTWSAWSRCLGSLLSPARFRYLSETKREILDSIRDLARRIEHP
jgi:hypothetical protein